MDNFSLTSFTPGPRYPRLTRFAVTVLLVLEIIWWCTIGAIITDFVETYRFLRTLEKIKREQDQVFWEHYSNTRLQAHRRLRRKTPPTTSNRTRP